MAEINAYCELLEKVAAQLHEQWSHWTEHFLENMTPENIKRWRRQIRTDYKDLSKKEQASDIEWARKVLDICFQKTLEAHCWRDLTRKCLLSKCCHDASCRAVFDYWKFANSDTWKAMVAEELKKVALQKSAYQQIDDLFYSQGLKGKMEFMQLLEKIKAILGESE